ncbi:hypothetical protein JI747_004405 [Chryseobacterium sp. RG1]|uniref:Uncharacterized protein n=1 Tax=Chryseobacterium tagetis TaxID=2801334 RepID=A0ABS7ZXG3_9FLAO|nr:hypothetical protein [Chryseobacterium tagetis]MCA6066409.1 hypothetical protein [Chryseobacterium tagetis]
MVLNDSVPLFDDEVSRKWNGKRIHYREEGSIEKTKIYKDRKLISTK